MASSRQNSKPVVFIGAAGQMCRIAVERFAIASNNPLVLSDINTSVLEALAASLPKGRATITKLDLFDRAALVDAIRGAALVVLGAGPYTRTSEPVLTACLEAKVPYLDFDDDMESTQAALGLAERANEAGVPCYIGCGASPGMTNVMAVDVARDLDSVDALDVCWLVGDERPDVGKAVLEHLMHIAAGPCLTWADGKATVNESWVETGYAPMVGKVGETLLYETAHPEPVTLPRFFPHATRIRCIGGLGPPPMNGIARGLGNAVRRQALPIEDAIGFLHELVTKPPSSAGWGQALTTLAEQFRGGDITVNELFALAGHATQALDPWRHALMGMIEQIWAGECTTGEVLGFIISSARGQTYENHSSLLVRAVGTKNGHPAVAIKRTPKSGKDAYLMKNMGTVTGTACAAFMVMAVESAGQRSGVFCPEDWAEPAAFYQALEKVGVAKDEIIERL
ncbi:saccharopine dehydrogenase domain-containing protein [Purpureocillium lavendulum]|uniref:Saccharopine dehydrogenase domain-containing protein n=1 Tax=Purpureocillium lavendulum TaxID=1247861 RepID=A0AB34G0U8_9HYPO|nr:saccharopine dehydrogenase domain-containing protein [Purpureocillium lavendulum]